MKKYPHQEALEDNNIQLRDVPEVIRKKVYLWNARYKNFEENPKQKTQQGLIKDSIQLADMIQNFAEEKATNPLPATDSAPTQTNALNSVLPTPETTIAGIVDAPSNNDLKSSIQTYLSKEGRIYVDDLKKILSQRSLPDRVEVGDLVLNRSFAFYYPS